MFTEKTVDSTRISVEFTGIWMSLFEIMNLNATDILVQSTVFSVNITDLSINIPEMPLQLTFL